MTWNSLIISRNSSGINMGSYGCSEFIAQQSDLRTYTTICLYALGEISHKTTNDAISYMEGWIRFVYEAFECMNIASVPFITLYTFADLKNESMGGMSSLGISIDKAKNELHFSNGINYTMKDETLLGITVDVAAVRNHFKLGTDNARKVQMTHTALRYAWSNAGDITKIALAISKIAPQINKLHILNIAVFLRRKVLNINSYDYGSLHQDSAKLVTKDMFMSKFADPKVTGVQAHFVSEDTPLMKLILAEENLSMDYILTFQGKAIGEKEILEPTAEYGIYLSEWINRLLLSKDVEKLKVNFKFVKTIFRSTAPNVPYSGYKKEGKVIERILFEDEEGTILSVPKNSNLIEIS